MAKNKLMPLYEQVAMLIEQDIKGGRFAPGEKIYSIREICTQFDVADVTAKKALKQLVRKQLIRTVAGSGVFVRDADAEESTEPASCPPIGFLKCGLTPDPIYVYGIDLIQQELNNAGYAMIYNVVENEDDVLRAIGQLKDAGTGCVVIFPSHSSDFEETGYMTALRRSGIPLLVTESKSRKDSYVTADVERATLELADYLYDTGHRNICLASAFVRKAAGFQKALARWQDPAVRHWIIGETGKSDQDSYSLAQRVLQLDPRPTAVIAGNDHSGAVFISCFLQAGLRVPEDISVATFDDHPGFSQLSPVPMTVLRHPSSEIAQEVARWVDAQLRGTGTGRRLKREITGTLIVRDSTGPGPAAQA